MDERDFQDDLLILRDDEEPVDVFDPSPYYHNPDYPEFDGWRDLVL